MEGSGADVSETQKVVGKEPEGDKGMCYVRVRGETRLPCRSLMSKNTENPNRRHARHANAVARLYPSHLSNKSDGHSE